jgi:hypothetical protein
MYSFLLNCTRPTINSFIMQERFFYCFKNICPIKPTFHFIILFEPCMFSISSTLSLDSSTISLARYQAHSFQPPTFTCGVCVS